MPIISIQLGTAPAWSSFKIGAEPLLLDRWIDDELVRHRFSREVNSCRYEKAGTKKQSGHALWVIK